QAVASEVINVFGLKSRAERVLFVIDAGRHMLEDNKGGLYSYRIIKQEITNMVSNLSAGTLFNVAFYDNGNLYFFKPRPIPAGAEVTAELQKWVSPINADAKKRGLPSRVRPEIETLPEHPVHQSIMGSQYYSPNENAYVTQVFLEQSIDAVFLITGRHGGFDAVRRPWTPKEEAAWRKKTSDPKYQAALKAHNAEANELKKKAKNKLDTLNKQRAKNGLPPKIIDGGMLGAMGLKHTIPHPGHPPHFYIEQRQVERYFKDVIKELYEGRGGQAPTMNVILFLAADAQKNDKQEKEIKDYVSFFKGRYKVIRGLNQIKGASSTPAPDEPE
ncbi:MULTISPECIES: hypothetical protein, partial [unclassified Lentimonas]|uniref:hypothetical protein n=2 Tax=Lentimonas TaxID=417293 RepID=UPI00132CBC3A